MSLRRRVLEDDAIPDASLEVFQWPYDGKSSSIDDQSKYHAVVDGTYIVASVGTNPTIAFGIRIVSKSGTFTQEQIYEYASTYRIVIEAPSGYYFPRIDLCGMGTSGFQAWGQAYMSNPTTIGLLEYGAALVIDSPGSVEVANGTNSGGITPSLVLTWTLQNFENQVVTTPICVKNYFAVLEEVRNYAIYDSSFTAKALSNSNPVIQQSLADDMLNDERYGDEQLRLFDSSLGLEFTWELPGARLDSTNYNETDLTFIPKDFPFLMEYRDKTNLISHPNTYNSSSPQSMGVTTNTSDICNMNMNNMIAFKFRTNFQTVKLSYPSSTYYKKIQFVSMNTTTTYNLRTSAYPVKFVGVSDCEFWVVFKIARYNQPGVITQSCRLTFTQSEASGRTTSMTFDFKITPRNHMILKFHYVWGLANAIPNWSGPGNPHHELDHWLTYKAYVSDSYEGENNITYFTKVGPPIGEVNPYPITGGDSSLYSGPWEINNPWNSYSLANTIYGGAYYGGLTLCGVVQLYDVECTLLTNTSSRRYIKVNMYTQNPENGTPTADSSMFSGAAYLANNTTTRLPKVIGDSSLSAAPFSLKLRASKSTGWYSGQGGTNTNYIFHNYDPRTWIVNTFFSPTYQI